MDEKGVNATQGMMVTPGGDIREAAGCMCDPAASKVFEWSAAGQPATRTARASPISSVVRVVVPRSARSAVTASSMRAASDS